MIIYILYTIYLRIMTNDRKKVDECETDEM